MIIVRRLVLLFFILLSIMSARAQSYSPQQIDLAERLQSIAKNAPPEIAYIQTSKDIYETGEDLWFKVYLLDAQYLVPSLLSKTLYLQLLNENNKKTIWQEKYEIQNGFANGRVYLDTDLPEGDYLLAACTPNSFFNDTTEFKAIKKIRVTADISSLQKGQAVSLMPNLHDKEKRIQFNVFPEGGNLVSGIKAKLAFKAVGTNGEPVDVSGTLLADSIPLLHFNSLHAGMGCFSFMPDANKKYSVKLSKPAIDSTFAIPEIYLSGLTIQMVERNKEFLSFKVAQRPGHNQKNIYLRVQCRGVVYGMTTAVLDSEIRIKVPLEGLPQGISEVTLFDSNLVPVAERLVYINQDLKLNITAELSKEIYSTRGKANLKISVKDVYGEPIVANLGISVFDKQYQDHRDSNNILSHYYLSTQLKGRIYNPSFYFNYHNNNCDDALDLLMLTQGWRKYVWSEPNLKKFKESPQQIIFDEIIGEIDYPNMKRRKRRDRLFVMAFSPNKDSIKVVIMADSAGKFNIPSDRLKEWEDDYVYMKPFGSYESQLQKKIWDPLASPEFNIHIRIKDPFETLNWLLKYKGFSCPLPGMLTEKQDTSDLFETGSDVIRIKEVTIKGQKAKIIRGKYLGSLDNIEMTKADNDYICRYGILNCPRHDRNEQGTTKPIQGFQYRVIYDYNTFGERTRLVTYWRPKYSEDELLKINNLSRVKAYYGNREFYQPNYDKETEETIIPDFRNTLLWEPSVITDEKGEATLNFFCSDINTEFVGRIEGVGGDGHLGSCYFNFTVRKVKFSP